MKMQKPTKNSTESEVENRSFSDLPFPRKMAAAIRDMPLSLMQGKPPHELTQALKKTFRNVGDDFAADHAKIHSPLMQRFQEEFQGISFADAFQHWSRMLNEIMCSNPTFSATVPVVLERFDTKKLEVIGSGVLIRIMNRTFLLTAAHVIDQQEDGTLLMPGKQGFMPMNGRFSSMRLPASGRRSDDKLDVAYCWLDNDCAAKLDSCCMVLEREDVSLEAKPDRRTEYTFAGFPWRKTNVTEGRVETNSQTLTGIEAKTSEYETMGLSRSLHIAIRFHRRRTFHQGTRRVGTAPLPHGMSGGGVYAWTEEALRTSPVRLPLIGIANTYIPERSLLIATRFHVYVGCIFHNQPDLAAIAAS